MDINPTTFAPAKFANVSIFVNLLFPLIIIGAAVIFLVMLLLGAFSWITGAGTPENMKKVQGTFTFAVLGLVIVLISYLAVKLIASLLKIQLPI